MSNTMDELSITRPPEVALEWVVTYKDQSELRQNYGKADEKTFGDINLPEVLEFWLEDSNGGRNFGVIPGTGTIIIAGVPIEVKFPKNPDDPNFIPDYRLIYFRRIRQDFGGVVQTIVKHCIGLQATVGDKNYQQLLFVGENGILELAQVK